MSNADEILKLKELLDKEIITQEEFEKKKSELLKSGVLTNNSSQTMFKNSNKKIKVKKISVGKSILYILLFLVVLGIIVSTMIGNNNNTITLIDGQAGKYGVYDENNVGYIYYLPVGTYKIISYKDTDMAIDLFNAVVWKSDDTSYSLKGKQYRKSASDEKIYTTKLSDTFTISENEYIYIPMGWTITLEVIQN